MEPSTQGSKAKQTFLSPCTGPKALVEALGIATFGPALETALGARPFGVTSPAPWLPSQLGLGGQRVGPPGASVVPTQPCFPGVGIPCPSQAPVRSARSPLAARNTRNSMQTASRQVNGIVQGTECTVPFPVSVPLRFEFHASMQSLGFQRMHCTTPKM